jgi:hypothetical protein
MPRFALRERLALFAFEECFGALSSLGQDARLFS